MAFRKRRRRSKLRGRRGGGVQFNVQSHIAREIWAILHVALGVMMFLTIRDQLGLLGDLFKRFLMPVFGIGIYVLPVLFFTIAGILFFSGTILFGAEKILGIVLFLVAVLGAVHLSVPFTDAYAMAQAGEAGGYVGFVTSFLASSVLGATGSYVLFFALFIISVLLVFEVSLMDIANFVNSIRLPSFSFLKRDEEERPTGRVSRLRKAAEDDVTKKTGFSLNIIRPDAGRPVAQSDDEVDEELADDVVTLRQVSDEDIDEELEVSVDSEEVEDAEVDAEEDAVPEDYVWEYPPLDLLDADRLTVVSDDKLLQKNAEKIREKLEQFGIEVVMQDVHVGPTVMQYTLKPDPAVKLSKIKGLKDDLALTLAAPAIRIEAPIPGKSLVGIEVPNLERATVHLREMLETPEYRSLTSKLALPIGRDVSGKPVVADLARMPHLLIAGATGAGKSVGLNAFLMSLLYFNSPQDLRLILIDPKRVELSKYNLVPHLLAPVVTEPDKAAMALRWAVAEMNYRYQLCAEAGHRSIDDYNADETIKAKMFKIVIVIDELADLMMAAAKEVEASICRIAQMARAVGMHLIVATQRPSVDVITGLIKANIPARIAFTTASSIDSRTILDTIGAEDLLGQGDLLFLSGTMSRPMRVQGIFVSTKEVEKLTNRLKLTRGPAYLDGITSPRLADEAVMGIPDSKFKESSGSDDDLYEGAVQVVLQTKKASASLLQRRLKVGYARAARLLDEMEQNGVVGPADGAKARKILVNN